MAQYYPDLESTCNAVLYHYAKVELQGLFRFFAGKRESIFPLCTFQTYSWH